MVVDDDATTTEKHVSGSAAPDVKYMVCSYDLEMTVNYSEYGEIVF